MSTESDVFSFDSLIRGSSTTKLVVSIVVVSPLIVKFPSTVILLNVTFEVVATS